MTRYVLVSNAGSSSLKVGLVSWPLGRPVGQVEINQIGPQAEIVASMRGQRRRRQERPVATLVAAARLASRILNQMGIDRRTVRGVVHRVVVADNLSQPVRMTAAVAQAIARVADRAPLHNPAALTTWRVWRRIFPRAAQVAVFDSGFFAALPRRARIYAIDYRLTEKYGLWRSGFHGLSHEAAARFAAVRLHRPLSALNLITVHLGSGCSIAAIAHGQPVDTSMGFSPLEGLVMSTRPGDLDSGILLHLLKHRYTVARLHKLLQHQSGWRGLSGVSDDFRMVLAGAGLPVTGWPPARRLTPAERRRCRIAVEVFIYRIQKYLGAYAAILDSLDAIVFTGAIGEGNATVRQLVVRGLRLPGRPRILVAPTDEQSALLRAARRLLR